MKTREKARRAKISVDIDKRNINGRFAIQPGTLTSKKFHEQIVDFKVNFLEGKKPDKG